MNTRAELHGYVFLAASYWKAQEPDRDPIYPRRSRSETAVELAWLKPDGSDEGWGAGAGWPGNGKGGRELRFVHGSNTHNLDRGYVIGIGDELSLSVEMTDRAIVNHGVFSIALSGRRLAVRSQTRGTMPKSGNRVQSRAAQGGDTIECQDCDQQKLVDSWTDHSQLVPKQESSGGSTPVPLQRTPQLRSNLKCEQVAPALSIR